MKDEKILNKPFNLLHSHQSNKSFVEKLYDWSMNVGRYIVIGTEMIVLVAFGIRFFMDQSLNDVTDKVNAENIKFKTQYSKVEKETNNVSALVAFAKQVNTDQVPYVSIISTINTAVPANLNIDSVDIIGGVVTITGTADSFNTVTIFRSKLQQTYPDVLTPDTSANSNNGIDSTRRTKFTLKFTYAANL